MFNDVLGSVFTFLPAWFLQFLILIIIICFIILVFKLVAFIMDVLPFI